MPRSFSLDAACRVANENKVYMWMAAALNCVINKNGATKLNFIRIFFFLDQAAVWVDFVTLVSINWASWSTRLTAETFISRRGQTRHSPPPKPYSNARPWVIKWFFQWMGDHVSVFVCTAIVTLRSYWVIMFLILMLQQNYVAMVVENGHKFYVQIISTFWKCIHCVLHITKLSAQYLF